MKLTKLTFFCILCTFALPNSTSQILETAKNPFQYLKEKGYNYENHTIVTEDGYKLLLVRLYSNVHNNVSLRRDTQCKDQDLVTRKQGKPAILFVHGLFLTFYDYLVAGPGIALGFQALEQGYDVFLLNNRGNTFSKNHTGLNPKKKKFWEFSWHEIGYYDLPATIDYILKITGQSQVSYVGFSQGCTVFVVAMSTRPNYNEKVKVAILIGPPIFMKHATNPGLVLFRRLNSVGRTLFNLLRIKEVLPYNQKMHERMPCIPNSPMFWLCKNVFYELGGSSNQVNESLMSAYFTNNPAGASGRQVLHYLQLARSDEFRQYDHGIIRNLLRYGKSTPPDYNLKAVTAPVALYYSTGDYFASLTDIAKLLKELPNVVRNELIWEANHLDLVIGTRSNELVNQPIMSLLRDYNNCN